MQTAQKRTVVTVEDRRAVLQIARVRKPWEVAEVPHEQFIRRMLKTRLGFSKSEPASDSIKEATRHLVKVVVDAAAAKARVVVGEVA